MNPVRRSALAIAAACSAVAVAPVVEAAPVEPGSTSTSAPSGGEGCEPAPPSTTTTTPPTTEPPTTVPTGTVPEPAPVTPSTTVETAPVETAPVEPPTTEPCEPTTVPSSSVPSTTVPPSSTTQPAATTTAPVTVSTTTETTTPEATTPETATPEATTPETTTTTVAEGAIGSPVPESSTGPAVEPVVPSAPIPPINLTWMTEGVPRFALPRIPGSGSLQLGRTPAGQRVVLAENVDVILATIRQLESGERYDIGPNRALASGAYQYIPSTWNNYGGYEHAYLAPPEVQDERARIDVERILAMYGGDVSMVPVMWYYPRAAIDPQWMDRVPNPAGGNRLTIRQYQARWVERLLANAATMLGTYVTAPATPAEVSVLSGVPDRPVVDTTLPAADARLSAVATPVTVPTITVPTTTVPAATVPTTTVLAATVPAATSEQVPLIGPPAPASTVPPPKVWLDEVTVSDETVELAARSVPPDYELEEGAGWFRPIVFPVLGPVAYADGWMDPRDGGQRRHEGTDIVGVQMQPILAAVDGVVTRVQHDSLGIRGVALTIRDDEGWRYNYFHQNDDTPGTDDGAAPDAFRLAPGLEVGMTVVAGQIIGYIGDSGNAEESVSHLHFEFRDPDGRARPSYWSLRSAEARQACTIGIGPWSTPNVPDDPEASIELGEVGVEVPFSGDDLAADGSPAFPTEHTVVTPMYGEGQWVIDSDGRVTATGDAALILPRRDLQCNPGPATPFGTDASGWQDVTADLLVGTELEGADLSTTVLDGVIPEPVDGPALDPTAVDPTALDPGVPAPTNDATAGSGLLSLGVVAVIPPSLAAPPVGEAEVEADDPVAAPMSFVDSATGETIIVVFDVPVRLDPLFGPR